MPPTIAIRPATAADLTLVLSLIRELAEYERAPNDVVATVETLRLHLFGNGLGRGPTAECAIGTIDSIPQGFAVWFHNFSTWRGVPGLYLEDLFVRPEARGSGLGKALFRFVAGVAVARGCPRMEWSVLDWNTPAIGFYEALGARPMSEWTTFRLTGEALARAAGV
jgi:GNAT superfamily N-acetyltransferase